MTDFNFDFQSKQIAGPGYLECKVPDQVRQELTQTLDNLDSEIDPFCLTLVGHNERECQLPITPNLKYLTESLAEEYGKIFEVNPFKVFVNDNEDHEFNRFVLTGNQTGDFNVTRAMINNLCDPQNNLLLLYPISDNIAPNLPHPQILVDINDPLGATQPVFSDTGPGSSYDTILTWISMGAASNPTCLN